MAASCPFGLPPRPRPSESRAGRASLTGSFRRLAVRRTPSPSVQATLRISAGWPNWQGSTQRDPGLGRRRNRRGHPPLTRRLLLHPTPGSSGARGLRPVSGGPVGGLTSLGNSSAVSTSSARSSASMPSSRATGSPADCIPGADAGPPGDCAACIWCCTTSVVLVPRRLDYEIPPPDRVRSAFDGLRDGMLVVVESFTPVRRSAY